MEQVVGSTRINLFIILASPSSYKIPKKPYANGEGKNESFDLGSRGRPQKVPYC
jgi:hypothetical protein